MSGFLDTLPTREPMRPRRRPRRMRPTGRRAPAPFEPTLPGLLQAAGAGSLRTNRHGRFVDATGRAVNQRIATTARRRGLLIRRDEAGCVRSTPWGLSDLGSLTLQGKP